MLKGEDPNILFAFTENIYSLLVSRPFNAVVKSNVLDEVVDVWDADKSAFDHSTVYEVIGENPQEMSVDNSFHVRDMKLTPYEVTHKLRGASLGSF